MSERTRNGNQKLAVAHANVCDPMVQIQSPRCLMLFPGFPPRPGGNWEFGDLELGNWIRDTFLALLTWRQESGDWTQGPPLNGPLLILNFRHYCSIQWYSLSLVQYWTSSADTLPNIHPPVNGESQPLLGSGWGREINWSRVRDFTETTHYFPNESMGICSPQSSTKIAEKRAPGM
jgi:hypothetical protein